MSPMKPGRGQAPRNPPPKAQKYPPPPPANSGMGGHRRVTTTPEPSTSPSAQAPPAPRPGITMAEFGQRMARLTDAASDQDITDRIAITDVLASCSHPQPPGHRIGDKAICVICGTASHIVATGVHTEYVASTPPPPSIHSDGYLPPDPDPDPAYRFGRTPAKHHRTPHWWSWHCTCPIHNPPRFTPDPDLVEAGLRQLRGRLHLAALEHEVMDTTPQEWVDQACAAFDQAQADLAAGKPGPPPSDPGRRARY